jgi:hypothetical protein
VPVVPNSEKRDTELTAPRDRSQAQLQGLKPSLFQDIAAGLKSLCENTDSEQPAAKAVLIAIDLRHG